MAIWDILGGPIKGLVDSVGSIIDDVTTTDEEKQAAKAQLQEIANSAKQQLLERANAVDEMRRDVIVAELQQDDKYTKRARPSIIYVGLAAFVLNYVVLPWTMVFLGIDLPTIDFPEPFWWAWGGVTGAYAIGRSSEKRAKANGKEPNMLTKLVTGAS